MEGFNSEFGSFIHAIRKANGLTKAELARRTGLSVRTIEYWETGQRVAKLESFIKSLVAMGMDVEINIKGKGEVTDDTNWYTIRY